MVEYVPPKSAILVIGTLLLFCAPLELNTHTSGQPPFPQGTNNTTLLGSMPPPPFEPLSAHQIATSTNKECTLTPSLLEIEGTPQQIEGPYFVDGMLNRSNLRSSDGTIQEGIPLHLNLNVYDVDDDGSCVPFSGAKVDIWEANPQGIYSGVAGDDTEGKDFLRGYQITDDNGTVQFTTVYPGWYEGRAIHIHVKVRSAEALQNAFEWTSQFYLNNSINEQVHKQPPYSDHGPVAMLNEEDGIYAGPSTDGLIQANAGRYLMLNLSEDPNVGYIGTFNIGVNATT